MKGKRTSGNFKISQTDIIVCKQGILCYFPLSTSSKESLKSWQSAGWRACMPHFNTDANPQGGSWNNTLVLPSASFCTQWDNFVMYVWLTTVIDELMVLACAHQTIGSRGLTSWKVEWRGALLSHCWEGYTLLWKENLTGRKCWNKALRKSVEGHSWGNNVSA